MLKFRIASGFLMTLAILGPQVAYAGCSQVISQAMSRDMERLTTRFHRVSQRMERQGSSTRLAAEKCRIAKQLEPRLAQQVAALRDSGCSKDPEVGAMINDIVRGREDEIAVMRKTARAHCR